MYKQHLKRSSRTILSPRRIRLRTVFWGGALLIGITAALFALMSQFSDEFFSHLYHTQPLIAYALPPFGFALIVWLTRKFFKGSEGSGIPQAIAALSMHQQVSQASVLSLKVALGKILLTCLGLLSGGSIGREGPTVHVGASIMYSLRHIAPFRGKDMTRGLILAGGAAGISAAFNTPLAGIMFAIEEMGRSFDHKSSGRLIIAVVLAGITALMILGDYTYFGLSTATLPLSSAWLAVLICGVVGGLLGGLFSTLLISGTRHLAPISFR
ncbi:MAG: chloride channel protein, partial [Gammaproteobacteria bacterium]|nr:chloride channel protein [Gammaproteobacteria bacterium]